MKQTFKDPKVFLGYKLIRETGTSVWHRSASSGRPFCGAYIGNVEQRTVPEAHPLSPDEGLCERCRQMFDDERRRRLGEVYALLIDLASRHRAAQERAHGEENATGEKHTTG